MRFSSRTAKRLIPALVISLLVLATGVTYADLTITASVLTAWDEVWNRFENGNLRIAMDGGLTPHYVQTNFDNDIYQSLCGPTAYAGLAEVGHYHVDNNPAGGFGFQSTQDWRLVYCSDLTTKTLPPGIPGLEIDAGLTMVGTQDTVRACSTGNCATEIVTQWEVNLDPDCDGTPVVDPAVTPICLAWNAVKPNELAPGYIAWRGNIQSRVSVGGGDKTINFSTIPLAVTLANFDATCQASTPVIEWTTVSEIDTAGFNLWRGETDAAPEVQLNASMILAHPGSTVGYSYSFTDATAQPGVPYFYWLEDIDLYGATNLNGPIAVTCADPTAVTVSSLEAGSASAALPWWAPLTVVAAGMAAAGWWSRRAKIA